MARADRVFEKYRRKMIPVACLGGALTVLLGWGLLEINELFGLIVLPLTMLALADRLVLCGNGWLRRRVAERLGALGETVDTGLDRFVGLAHPCHLGTLGRRIIETDDDVGFLEVDASGLAFHGDGIEFHVDADQVTSVRQVRGGFAPWRRIEVEFADGEPFDSVIFDSRHFTSHARCRADNGRLFELLTAMVSLNERRQRLTEGVGERATIDAVA